ncbi:multicomponent Na+:H+ antiporter subunit E [Mumia flava]|uniref:Multicomponent Na+:H+ antiporter subunit E n=1 Tax=Mumia flava TaxID=1348852 RepID=A0A2M9BGZ4_9ACTN|nr:Na+/H+ antiporter subunit E [Mumia flava]PJJ57216.1 multicomponent Na+:H+ antiporter subunit E [Mumia flava]
MSVTDGRPERRERARSALQWPAITWLTAVWVLLWGDLSVANVLAGLLIAFAVIRVFPQPPIAYGGVPRPLALVRLAAVFLAELTVSSVQVAAQALRFGHQPRNAVVVVGLRTRNELHLMLTAELVSLVPGSLLIEASRRTWTLQVHLLGVDDEDAVERGRQSILAQEARVVRAFGTAEEIAALDVTVPGVSPPPDAQHPPDDGGESR